MGQFDAAKSKQMGILKQNYLELHGKELEEAQHTHTSVHFPQPFRKNDESESEEPEMDSEEDPEEEPEEDPEEETEEDPEEEPEADPEEELVEGFDLKPDDNQKEHLSEEEDATPFKLCTEIISTELTEREDEYPSAECVFEPNPENETDKIYQKDEKLRIVVNPAFRPRSQHYVLKKNCTYDKADNLEFNTKYPITDHHSEPGGHEAVGGEENSRKEAVSGKRRHSRWDQDPEYDKNTVINDGKIEKGKAMCDYDDWLSRLQEPLQLADFHKRVEVMSFKKRFSNISSILDSLVDEERATGIYAPDKLIKERDWILFELAKRNEIFCKKLYIPVKEYPTYNFIGPILGPKGNTQKRMELKSGSRIRLRGKGLSKSAQEADPSENEDLHVYIEAISQKSLDAAVCMIEKLLVPVEDEMNDHKRAQLQELYDLKAESCISSCSLCMETGHNQLACPLKKTTLKAACDTCGNFSHPTSGCPVTPLNLKIKSSREMDAASLYIGFLPQSIDDIRLRELFSPFGKIIQSRVILDMRTGYSKGYGFVKFDTPAAANLAIMHMNGHQIDGHRLVVRIFGTPPATILFPVCPNPGPGPAAVATNYTVSPHYMMPQAQLPTINAEGIGFPESNSQTESRIVFPSTSLISGSSESNTTYMSTGMVSAGACSSTVVATSCLELPDSMMPQEQVSVLNTGGCGLLSSLNMEYLTNLYVGFLPQTVDDSRLWGLFSPFGTITQLKVALDRTGYSKGYGFVRYDTPSAESLAIMYMNGYQIDGHKLTVKIADTPPVRGQPATIPNPVFPNLGPAAVASICPGLPQYMMPKEQVSGLNGEGMSFTKFSQTEASIVPQGISGSTSSSTALPSTAFVSRPTEFGTTVSSTGLISVSTESRTALSTTGLVEPLAESRSVISSYSFSSLFCADSNYPGSLS